MGGVGLQRRAPLGSKRVAKAANASSSLGYPFTPSGYLIQPITPVTPQRFYSDLHTLLFLAYPPFFGGPALLPHPLSYFGIPLFSSWRLTAIPFQQNYFFPTYPQFFSANHSRTPGVIVSYSHTLPFQCKNSVINAPEDVLTHSTYGRRNRICCSDPG